MQDPASAPCRRSPARPFPTLAGTTLAALALLAPAAAMAGLVESGHRLERVGPAPFQPVALLDAPGTGAALAFARTGEVVLLRGDGLPGRFVARVPVDSSCPERGLLDAAWDPGDRGGTAYVSFTAAGSSSLTVSRLDVPTGTLTQVYVNGTGTPCANLGGGLAFMADGTLLLGVGDMGQPTQAAAAGNRVGKILRMTTAGRTPAAPLAVNPLTPSSFVYAFGVRNPIRLAADEATGDVWFLDIGPSGDAELNRVVPLGNFGWDASMIMGFRGTLGLEDPFFAWVAGTSPSGLVAYTGENLGSSLRGTILVGAAGTGAISAVTPDELVRDASVERVLFLPDATGPQGFAALTSFTDGIAYLADDAGNVVRLLSVRGALLEPSSFDSMLPLTVRKVAGGNVEVAVERVPGTDGYGLHVGDVMTLATGGYSHDRAPALAVPVDGRVDEALTRATLPLADLGAAGTSSYFLASARRTCAETGLGSGFAGPRPIAPGGCTIDVLGGGTHSIDDVIVSEIFVPPGDLALPRDLEFHPTAQNELWIVNRLDYSTVIVWDPGEPTQLTSKRRGSAGQHFLAQPSALAFGPGTGFFATSHEEDDYTQGPPPSGTPQDFMGPTLWTDDSAVYDGGHPTHYDMLHNSPNATGIAWESGNAYWVNDGWHASLTRYDFADDHGPGGADHSDGIITRYAEGEIGYVPDIVAHVVYDHERQLVYAVDTGNNRVMALDPATGTNVGPTPFNYDGCSQTKVDGALTWTLIDGSVHGMVAPSGMEMFDGLLFVSDNATSRILAFTRDGELVDWLDTGFPPGTLMGMAFDPRDGALYVVDTLAYKVLQIRPRP